jgi:hypothetical protein
MQVGGTINITAKEECSFTVNDKTGSVLYFCYDGVCGPTTTAAGVTPNLAIDSIVDDNGDQILAGDTTTFSTQTFKVIMPMGKSCDGLEMRVKTPGSVTSIVKSVNKHNNGKVFKITRSFVQVEGVANPGTFTAATTTFTFANGNGHTLLPRASTLVISDKSGGNTCAATTGTDYSLPFNRVIKTQSAGPSGVAAEVTVDTITNAASGDADTECDFSLRRYVITLDSMPTASAYDDTKTLLYQSPIGDCNVAETTKGTFESYECSNRGACDGKSGLCACYAGYSGESCQTQTVLV